MISHVTLRIDYIEYTFKYSTFSKRYRFLDTGVLPLNTIIDPRYYSLQ